MKQIISQFIKFALAVVLSFYAMAASAQTIVKIPKTGEQTYNITDVSTTYYVRDPSSQTSGQYAGYYDNNSKGYLLLTAPEGYVMEVWGSAYIFQWSKMQDHLDIFDGSTTEADCLGQFWCNSETATYPVLVSARSTSNQLLFYFYADGSGYDKGFNLKVRLIGTRPVDALIITVPDQTYTGSALTPVTVKDGETTLVENTDYTVTYTDNINVGTATATITGIGNYQGSVEKQFKIVNGEIKTLTLSSTTNNDAAIAAAADNGSWCYVTLSDHILYADGDWNTLTLPFSLTEEQVSTLQQVASITLKQLNGATSGFDDDGKLTLNFEDATTIEAGKPYIVKLVNTPDLIIHNKSDWDKFADDVNSGNTYEGKLVMLADNFDNSNDPVTTMVGTGSSKLFKGTFDGNGRKLTVNYNSTAEYVAPFSWVGGATIRNLQVAGIMTSSDLKMGGFVGILWGDVNIENCISSAVITTNYTTGNSSSGGNAGFVAFGDYDDINISNCLFNGQLLSGKEGTLGGNGGFIGYASVCQGDIKNCLFAPSANITMNTTSSKTFVRRSSGRKIPTVTNSYYTMSFGEEQGTDASSMSASALVSALGSSKWEVVSGKAVPKMNTVVFPTIDVAIPTTDLVTINATASTVASSDGKVSFVGTYSPFTNTDGLLFDTHNSNNRAFHAALSGTRDGYTVVGWFTDANLTKPATSIPFGTDGSVTLYAKWAKQLTNTDITVADIAAQTYTGSAITPTVTVKDGNKTLTLGTDYTITLPDGGCINATDYTVTITGKGNYSGKVEKTFTIAPKVTTLGALTLSEYGNRTIATLQGEFVSMLDIVAKIEVDELTFHRTFKAGVPATIMLPFDFTPDNKIGNFYTLASVAPDSKGVWTATMSQPITGTIQANTPYIFKANSNLTKLTFANGDDGISLKSTKTINDNTNGDWTLHGVYEKTFLDDPNQVNYGFAGQASDDDGISISVGQFIRAGEGVWADPMRCYLTYNGSDARLAKAALDLPDRIRVVFPDEVEQPDNGEIVTPVSEISSESGVKVWSFNSTIFIEAQPDMDYTIVDLTGRTIKTGVTHSTREEITLSATGIVIVKIANNIYKLSM